MSTQNDLVLIGNVVLDEVFAIDSWPPKGTSNILRQASSSIGGLGNMIKALSGSGLNIRIEANASKNDIPSIRGVLDEHAKCCFYESPKTSKALIFCDDDERTSFVDWGSGLDPIPASATPSKWTHISYLDVTPFTEITAARCVSEVLSADLCLSRMPDDRRIQLESQLKHLDFLFISTSELPIFSREGENEQDTLVRIKNMGPRTVIVHRKDETTIVKDNRTSTLKANANILTKVNVLGAGDAYCASFIKNMLSGRGEAGSILSAHEDATRFIQGER